MGPRGLYSISVAMVGLMGDVRLGEVGGRFGNAVMPVVKVAESITIISFLPTLGWQANESVLP